MGLREALPLVGESELKPYLSAQTAFYSLNPDRDIYGPLVINPTYIRLAQASYHGVTTQYYK